MKKLLFWWHWLTDSGFRHYVYLHDMQRFQDEILLEMKNKAEYESHKLFMTTL